MVDTPELPDVTVYTDGACDPNPGPGGWAAVVRDAEGTRELSGREEKTSANRLHLLAVRQGLAALPEGLGAHVYTASDYVAWVRAWARNGWRTKEGQPVKHSELWQAILAVQGERRVTWHALKNDKERPEEAQRADTLAQAAARQDGQSD